MGKTIIKSAVDLLWTNPNPTASFGVNTGMLTDKNISKYSYLEIDYVQAKGTGPVWKAYFPVPTSRTSYLLRGVVDVITYRAIYIGTNYMDIDGGYYYGGYGGSLSPNNDVLVPIRIYGLK